MDKDILLRRRLSQIRDDLSRCWILKSAAGVSRALHVLALCRETCRVSPDNPFEHSCSVPAVGDAAADGCISVNCKTFSLRELYLGGAGTGNPTTFTDDECQEGFELVYKLAKDKRMDLPWMQRFNDEVCAVSRVCSDAAPILERSLLD